MIFATRRAYREAVEKEISDREFRSRTDLELYKLRCSVEEMDHRLSVLEHRLDEKPGTPVDTAVMAVRNG